ncbi:hypothetical protein BDB01DRAFT_848087 [Pilobolus umbonatus]|nr:hypothetical protein BDB01DRAFT_848087 [Pilobolus umbonatus]
MFKSDITKTLSIDEQMIFLCDNFGNQGHLDLTTTTIAKRFGKSIENFGLKLQPTLAREERDILLEIAGCTDITSLNRLLTTLHSDIDMNPMCRYIRLALSNMFELWSSDNLITADHNESCTKRADCISNITKEFNDIANQRVDFIIRNLNDKLIISRQRKT